MGFIELHLGSFIISHGYNEKNEEIEESVTVSGFAKKTIAIDRIKSLSEQYLLTDYGHGRWIYWEYAEDYETICKMLQEK
ncbi:hypothetical protein [Sediminicola luteus]|nr:hypothetical protein [Sediminicola luteus]